MPVLRVLLTGWLVELLQLALSIGMEPKGGTKQKLLDLVHDLEARPGARHTGASPWPTVIIDGQLVSVLQATRASQLVLDEQRPQSGEDDVAAESVERLAADALRGWAFDGTFKYAVNMLRSGPARHLSMLHKHQRHQQSTEQA